MQKAWCSIQTFDTLDECKFRAAVDYVYQTFRDNGKGDTGYKKYGNIIWLLQRQ